jgi:mRNA deadenylase 3'-5' endonuclease subunit Ccr4
LKKIFDKCSIKYDAINESKKTSMENVLGINKELFSIEKHEIIHLEGLDGKKSGRHMICALIVDKKTNNKFIVLVVHLTAKAEKENIRLFQMDHIIRYIEKNLLGKYPIFFLGDFNAEPTYPSMVKFFENKNICPKSLFDLKELDFTTIKLRDVLYRRVIDYIFFIPKNKDDIDKELKILSVEKAKPVLDEKIGLPNDIFPSEHLFLKAKVELTFT